jgi:hypothetical protein
LNGLKPLKPRRKVPTGAALTTHARANPKARIRKKIVNGGGGSLRGLREVLLACAACALMSVCASAQTLERVFIKGARLTHGGYVVTRAVVEREGESRAVISRGGRELVRLTDGAPRDYATRIGLFPFLGRGVKQLVVEQYTGGAHCCTVYHVYDLGAELRTLFDGGEYGVDEIGEDMRVVDIDGDGRYEFTLDVMAFDYFLTSHAGSVFPTAVFAYDERAGKYLPANPKFSAYLLRGVEREARKVEETNRRTVFRQPRVRQTFHGEHFRTVLDVLLKYVYAGEERKGWAFFEKNYMLSDKAEVEAGVKAKLLESAVYRATYGLAPLKKEETDAR